MSRSTGWPTSCNGGALPPDPPDPARRIHRDGLGGACGAPAAPRPVYRRDASSALEGKALYSQFEAILDQLHRLGFFPETQLVSAVARSMLGLPSAAACRISSKPIVKPKLALWILLDPSLSINSLRTKQHGSWSRLPRNAPTTLISITATIGPKFLTLTMTR